MLDNHAMKEPKWKISIERVQNGFILRHKNLDGGEPNLDITEVLEFDTEEEEEKKFKEMILLLREFFNIWKKRKD